MRDRSDRTAEVARLRGVQALAGPARRGCAFGLFASRRAKADGFLPLQAVRALSCKVQKPKPGAGSWHAGKGDPATVNPNERLKRFLEPARQSRESLVLRDSEPLNLEGCFTALNGLLTPTEQFYVRSHFPVPEIDTRDFQLRIDGAVQKATALRLEELLALPAVTRRVTLECAGNGRIFLDPPAEGVQWQLGAVGTAEWTGVRLCDALECARLRPEAVDLMLEGADRGEPAHQPAPPGAIAYARSLPVCDAEHVLLAYAMNGAPLSREHGFPLRAIVAGHFAMASVKWLTRISVLTEPFQGYFQTSDYAYWDETSGQPVRRPLRAMALKASIARPVTGAVVEAGSVVTIAGAAWSGGPEIEGVEVSTDGGATWAAAELLDPAEHGVWRRWQFAWQVPQPGEYTLLARARDAKGRVQPGARDPRWGAYAVHHVLPATVSAR
jgi:DMSO/TMAO reductase YedYZ molybdopterin-dependent catalytic subunit